MKTKTTTKSLVDGAPLSTILLFTIPLLIGNVFQQLYNVIDTIIVSHTISVEAFAAIGSIGPLNSLITGFATGAASGFAIVISHYYGAKDKDGVRRSFLTGLFLSTAIPFILTLFAVPLTRTFLIAMKTPADILDDATQYLRIIFIGMIFTTVYNYFLGAVRAVGNSRSPLIFLVMFSVLNIILDYVFIVWGNMGVAGAALANVVAQVISCVLCFVYIIKRMPDLMHHASWDDINIRQCRIQLRMGLPVGLLSFIIAIGSIILQMSLNSLGSAAVAAYTAATKVEQIVTTVIGSLGISVGAFTAQNFGAKRIDRIKEGVKKGTIAIVAYSIVMGAIMIIFGGQIVTLFIGEATPEVISLAKTYLIINGACYSLLCILYTTRYALQGMGMNKVPTFAGFMESVMRIAAALLATTGLGFVGISLSAPLAWLGASVPLVYAYLKAMRILSIRLKVAE